MEKKAIQEERVRGYFLTAAKELIRGEGIAVVSARNVSERAGYSYATLYNYFKDIRDLIFACIEDFMKDCREFVTENSKKATAGRDRFHLVTRCYMNFFVQYPGIFELFYSLKPSSISTGKSDLETLYNFFDTLTEKDWVEACKASRAPMAENDARRKYHKLAIHGIMSMYLNRRLDTGYKEFADKIDEINDFFLK
jgi:AcrR family transcriptional regulator